MYESQSFSHPYNQDITNVNLCTKFYNSNYKIS